MSYFTDSYFTDTPVESKLIELEAKFSKDNLHILSGAQVRRHGKDMTRLSSRNLQYIRGKENISGVGFLIYKELANNIRLQEYIR